MHKSGYNQLRTRRTAAWVAAGTLLIGAALGRPSQAGAVNLLVNASFENPHIGGKWALIKDLPGWEYVNINTLKPAAVKGYEIEIQNTTLFTSVSGQQHIEADQDGFGIMQTVQTIVGHKYELNGWYAPRPDVEWQDAVVGVLHHDDGSREKIKLGGHGLNFINGKHNIRPAWERFTLTFIGTGWDSIFLGSLLTKNPGPVFNPGAGNLFDHLRLLDIGGPAPEPEPIPEPISALLLLSGLAGARAARRSSSAL